MNNRLNNNNKKIMIGVALLFLLFVSDLNGQIDNKNNFKDDLKVWLDWKIQQPLPTYQREVIKYIQIAGNYYGKGIDVFDNSKNQLTGIEKIDIINSSINFLKKTKYPKQCEKYREILLRHLILIKENFDLKQRGFSSNSEKRKKLIAKIRRAEGEVYVESFRLLKDINLFVNFDNELAGLRNKL